MEDVGVRGLKKMYILRIFMYLTGHNSSSQSVLRTLKIK